MGETWGGNDGEEGGEMIGRLVDRLTARISRAASRVDRVSARVAAALNADFVIEPSPKMDARGLMRARCLRCDPGDDGRYTSSPTTFHAARRAVLAHIAAKHPTSEGDQGGNNDK